MPLHGGGNKFQYAKLNASTQAQIDVSQPLGKGSFKEVRHQMSYAPVLCGKCVQDLVQRCVPAVGMGGAMWLPRVHMRTGLPCIQPPLAQLSAAHRGGMAYTSSCSNVHACAQVYQGVYVSGPNEGERCVAKLMIQNDDAAMEEDFAIELDVVAEARRIVQLFNEGGFIDHQIYVTEPEIWRFDDACEARWRGRLCLVEPLILDYTRFNSNTGFNRDSELDWPRVMQALSHFSYYKTGGSSVLCDLQGGSMGDDIVLTDPIVMTRSKSYGQQDLGKRGLELFFTHHKCNKYCHKARAALLPLLLC